MQKLRKLFEEGKIDAGDFRRLVAILAASEALGALAGRVGAATRSAGATSAAFFALALKSLPDVLRSLSTEASWKEYHEDERIGPLESILLAVLTGRRMVDIEGVAGGYVAAAVLRAMAQRMCRENEVAYTELCQGWRFLWPDESSPPPDRLEFLSALERNWPALRTLLVRVLRKQGFHRFADQALRLIPRHPVDK